MGYRGCCGLGSDPHAPEGANCMDCGKKLWVFNRRHEALGVDGPLCTKCVTSRSQGMLHDDHSDISEDEELLESSSISSSRSPSRDQLSSAPVTPLVANSGGASASNAPALARSVTPEQRATSSTQPSMPSLSLETETIPEEDDDPQHGGDNGDLVSTLMQFFDHCMDILGGPLGRYGAPLVLLCVGSFYFTGVSFADVVYFIVGLVLVTPVLHTLQGDPQTAVTTMVANSIPGLRPKASAKAPEDADELSAPTAKLPIPKAGHALTGTTRSASAPRDSSGGGVYQQESEVDKGAESAPENNIRVSVSEPPQRSKMFSEKAGKNYTMDTTASTPESSYRDTTMIGASAAATAN